MKKANVGKITVDTLAAMMQKNFLATDRSIAEGFKKVNDRLDNLAKKEEVDSLRARVRATEDALGIE